MKVLNTDKAPAAIGPYSQAIRTGNLVFVSGQLPIIPETGAFPEGGIKEQTRQSLLNARAILQSEGLDLKDVVKTTVFLSEIANFGPMNEVYAEFFTAPSLLAAPSPSRISPRLPSSKSNSSPRLSNPTC